MLNRIYHLGYAVEDIEAASRFYAETFGAEPGEPEVVEEQGIIATMFRVGESKIELVQPTRPDSPVGKFLAKRGEGFHHVAFEVDDLGKALAELKRNGVVTINNGPLLDNDDGFFYDGEGNSVFSEAVVDRPFTIQVRGAAVANRTEEATAYADIARGYLDRRVIVTAPSQAKASIDGLETVVEGYYLAAGLAGRKSAKAPQQPLTEDALTGFSGVVGSQDRYSEIQLRIMSGGGLWIFYQETDSSPVRTRQQLTSDVSTLLVREDSITQALDYAAALLRDTLRTFTGRFNITTDVKDALAIVCDGIRDFLIRNGVFQTFDVVSITQNEDEQDALDVIVDVTTLKPLNKIRVTMRVA